MDEAQNKTEWKIFIEDAEELARLIKAEHVYKGEVSEEIYNIRFNRKPPENHVSVWRTAYTEVTPSLILERTKWTTKKCPAYALITAGQCRKEKDGDFMVEVMDVGQHVYHAGIFFLKGPNREVGEPYPEGCLGFAHNLLRKSTIVFFELQND